MRVCFCLIGFESVYYKVYNYVSIIFIFLFFSFFFFLFPFLSILFHLGRCRFIGRVHHRIGKGPSYPRAGRGKLETPPSALLLYKVQYNILEYIRIYICTNQFQRVCVSVYVFAYVAFFSFTCEYLALHYQINCLHPFAGGFIYLYSPFLNLLCQCDLCSPFFVSVLCVCVCCFANSPCMLDNNKKILCIVSHLLLGKLG